MSGEVMRGPNRQTTEVHTGGVDPIDLRPRRSDGTDLGQKRSGYPNLARAKAEAERAKQAASIKAKVEAELAKRKRGA
jgi:hypothetical protein